MKMLSIYLLIFSTLNVFAADTDADYNNKRAIALVDAKLLGQRVQMGLTMDRYRIISNEVSSIGNNDVTVGVSGTGGECTVLVRFQANGTIRIFNDKCEAGS